MNLRTANTHRKRRTSRRVWRNDNMVASWVTIGPYWRRHTPKGHNDRTTRVPRKPA